MQNNKSLGNDGLTKEFYENFWNHIKETYFNSIRGTKLQNLLTISQRLAIIKLIVKKDRNKRLIKNWRLISLLNVDIKILSKALLQKLKENLPSLISSDQAAYMKNRHIFESGRIISDINRNCKIK